MNSERQKPYAHRTASPVNWCSRLLKKIRQNFYFGVLTGFILNIRPPRPGTNEEEGNIPSQQKLINNRAATTETDWP